MRPLLSLFALFFAAVALPAAAQAPQGTPVNIRGTVVSLRGHTLTVAARGGKHLTIALAPNFAVAAIVKRSLADIKDGDFVASTSVKGTDGKLHAIEVQILPNSLRGVAREGQFAWDLAPNSLMTNATAAGITAAPQGHVLHVTYKTSSWNIVVAPGTPVVGYAPGSPGLLKPGAAIFAIAMKKPDGTLTAAHVTAEKNGVKPPM